MQYKKRAITRQSLVGYSEEWRTRVSRLYPTEMSSHLDPKEKEVSILKFIWTVL